MSDDWGNKFFDDLKKQRDKTNMNVIDKYLTESKIKSNGDGLKNLILKGKTAVYDVDGIIVKTTKVDNTLILSYPGNELDLTYKLSQVSDELGKEYNQVGMGKKTMKFIIDLN